MYSRCERFPKLHTSTPHQVGPGTYNINGTIGKDGCDFAPFLSSQPRSISLGNKGTWNQPGPTSYYPITKQQPKGFVSMEKKIPRFAHSKSEDPILIDSELEKKEDSTISSLSPPRSSYSGKMARVTLVNREKIPVPSVQIPRANKNYIFHYKENVDGFSLQSLPKISLKNQERYISHNSMKLRRYKGVYFGNRTESRDSTSSRKTGPGPTDYDVISSKAWEMPISYTGRKWLAIHHKKDGKEYITLTFRSNEPLDTVVPVKTISFWKGYRPIHDKPDMLRYIDLLMRNATRENNPAPNFYDVMKVIPLLTDKRTSGKQKDEEASFLDEIRKKLHFKRINIQHKPPRPGFDSSSKRFITEMLETPAPGEYEVLGKQFNVNIQEDPSSAFLRRSPRFLAPEEFHTPGPGAYQLPGMVDELKKRSRPSRYLPVDWESPPFGSVVPRVESLSAIKDIPGPTSYNLQNPWERKHKNMDAAFTSQTERCITPPYMTSKHLRRATQLRREKARLMHGRKSDMASRLTCSAIFLHGNANAGEGQKVSVPPKPIQIKPKKVSAYPFNSTGQRVEVFRIHDYPGPGKYNGTNTFVGLKNSYSGRMTTLSKRFKKSSEVSPGPSDYQKVESEMNLKSFNVTIQSAPRVERIVNQMKRKCKKTMKKEGATISQFDNTIAICERGRRVLIMKKPYKSSVKTRVKRKHVRLPASVGITERKLSK